MMISMPRTYITHNEVLSYWRIEILGHYNPINDAAFIFKGKTVNGAIKAAQKYCDQLNEKRKYQKLYVGKVISECDYYGRTIQA